MLESDKLDFGKVRFIVTEKKTLAERHTEAVFKGKIELDIRDSVEDWGPYSPPVAPKDAPNVLFILYDDTGLATWSPFGGESTCQRRRNLLTVA